MGFSRHVKMDLFYSLLSLFWTFASGNEISSTPVDANNSFTSGKTLNVVTIPFASFTQVFRDASGNVTGFGGIFYEQLIWLSLKLNFSVHIEPSIDNKYGSPDSNGSWNGIYGQLQRGEIDLGLAPFTVKRGILDLAVYVVGDGFGMLVKYPMPHTAINGPIKVFSLYVWIGLLISMIACIGCIQLLTFLISKISCLNTNNDQTQYSNLTAGNTFMFILGTLTNHSVPSQNIPRSVKIVAAVWILATFVFVNVYSSCIMSYMSLRFQRPDINTFQDLAKNPNYLPTAIKGVVPESFFTDAKPGTMLSKIGDKFLQCNDRCRLFNYDGMVKNVIEENYVALLATLSGKYYIKKTMSDDNKCRLTMAQETMAFINMFLGVPIGSPFVRELNKASFWYNSLGFEIYWRQKMIPAPRQCLLQYNKNGEVVQLMDLARLKLEQLYVAFIVLFVGYIMAFMQFLRERFIHCG